MKPERDQLRILVAAGFRSQPSNWMDAQTGRVIDYVVPLIDDN